MQPASLKQTAIHSDFVDVFRAHVAICRIDHWTKNVFILPGVVVPLSVSPHAFSSALLWRLVVGILATCLVASSNYVLNELLDAPYDRLHPIKKDRPAASGLVITPIAY